MIDEFTFRENQVPLNSLDDDNSASVPTTAAHSRQVSQDLSKKGLKRLMNVGKTVAYEIRTNNFKPPPTKTYRNFVSNDYENLVLEQTGIKLRQGEIKMAYPKDVLSSNQIRELKINNPAEYERLKRNQFKTVAKSRKRRSCEIF
ncbi:unnamed protein product [Blepharisma stoltei]|uniref:Uncharacterized protein n=1 Tax=Blepharisma stoltei TaxID=1481888 RepID=A0AAU9ISA1_9CILI|nr:unnamed protein product [Blepharisma stoltei]